MSSTKRGREKAPSLLACLPCRSKHLKCDGRMPACGRCDQRAHDCVWIESRRGYKGSGKDSCQELGKGFGAPADGVCDALASRATEAGLLDIHSASPLNSSVSTISLPRHESEQWDGSPLADNGRLINLFYKYFWPAHPFVVPRTFLVHHFSVIPIYLRKAMCFVGSHYLPDVSREALRNSAFTSISGGLPETGFSVQALLLLGMASYARFERAQASEMVERAVNLAHRIGMNERTFYDKNPSTSPIVQESFLRTWWDLYIVNGLMSAMRGSRIRFKLANVPMTIPVPGSEEAYSQCLPQTNTQTLRDLEERAFYDHDFEWSSFAYKIEAMRIMGTVLSLGSDTFGASQDEVETVDASISNFLLSLPPGKRQVVKKDGTVDEVLFGAHMIIHWAAIDLHRPRSSLTYVRNHYRTACTREEVIGMPALEYAVHDAKALRAANAISSLAAVQTSMASHTPCFPCALALAATVQLPSSAVSMGPSERSGLRERLRLTVSTLGAIGEIWPISRVVRVQVAQFAREVFDPNPPPAGEAPFAREEDEEEPEQTTSAAAGGLGLPPFPPELPSSAAAATQQQQPLLLQTAGMDLDDDRWFSELLDAPDLPDTITAPLIPMPVT